MLLYEIPPYNSVPLLFWDGGWFISAAEVYWNSRKTALFILDLDECSNASLNACTQKCNNNVGSFTCSCDSGYRLSKNQQTCEDRDECAENQDSCQQICHNNIGSFTCSCHSDYKLAADNISCTGKLHSSTSSFFPNNIK